MARASFPASGSLERTSVAALLRELLRQQRDGCLTVTRGGSSRRLYLRRGMLIYATSTERQDRLGEILIAQGRLSRPDHRHFWELSEAEGRQLGRTLVVNGRITPNELYQGVTAQVVTILERLQKWRKGDYLFEEGVGPEAGTVLLCIPLALYLRPEPGRSSGRAAGKAPARSARGAAKGAARSAGGAKAAGTRGRKTAEAPPAPPPEAEEEITVPEAAEIPVPSPEEAAEQERIGEVAFLVQELRARMGQEPRALLGVAADAPRAEVRRALQRVAKVLHPDRLPRGASPELVQEAGELLRVVTGAVEAIEAEAASREQPAPAPAPALKPEELALRFFAQGREFVVRRNYWQAADALRQAVRLDPEQPRYRQYLALSLMQMRRHGEAEEHLAEAIRLEPGNATHWLNLGRIYRSGRRFEKARQAFERTLRLDPRERAAREELRELDEESPPERRGGGSLFSKLFGRG